MTLVPSEKFGYTHKGIVLPEILGGLGRKYFNIQNRFNEIQFHVTITSYNIPVILQERFEFFREMKAYNDVKLPYFMPMASSLNVLWFEIGLY